MVGLSGSARRSPERRTGARPRRRYYERTAEQTEDDKPCEHGPPTRRVAGATWTPTRANAHDGRYRRQYAGPILGSPARDPALESPVQRGEAVVQSAILVTQELAKPPPTTAEIGPNDKAVGPEAIRDLADWQVGEVEEDKGRPLAVRQAAKGGEQVGVAVPVEMDVSRGRRCHTCGRSSFQGAARDAERGTPSPGSGVPHRVPTVKDLGIGLGDRVAGDFGIAGPGVPPATTVERRPDKGPPQSVAAAPSR